MLPPVGGGPLAAPLAPHHHAYGALVFRPAYWLCQTLGLQVRFAHPSAGTLLPQRLGTAADGQAVLRFYQRVMFRRCLARYCSANSSDKMQKQIIRLLKYIITSHVAHLFHKMPAHLRLLQPLLSDDISDLPGLVHHPQQRMHPILRAELFPFFAAISAKLSRSPAFSQNPCRFPPSVFLICFVIAFFSLATLRYKKRKKPI